MPEYAFYNCTVRGARYVKRDKVCEDASVSYGNNRINIAVVADGHGDKACFRSNIGAEIACQSAVSCLSNFAESFREQEDEKTLLGSDQERLVTQLFRAIIDRWTSEVLVHLENNPLTDNDYVSAGSANAEVYRSGKALTHIYGTTLIAMMVTEKYALMLHHGDGRCVVLHENGEIDQPVPWDTRCAGRNTASLCDEDVLLCWRYLVIDLKKDRIIGCYALSDGIEDSFETLEEVNAFIGMMTDEYINMGREAYLAELPEYLSVLSKNGSTDDMSLACILDAEAAAPYARKYSLLYEYYAVQSENKNANERLNSMKRKTAYLEEQLEMARKRCEQLMQSHMESKNILEKLREKLSTALKEVEEHTQQRRTAEVALALAQKEYDDYMAVRAQITETAETTKKKMEELFVLINEIQKPTNTTEKNKLDQSEDNDELVEISGNDTGCVGKES